MRLFNHKLTNTGKHVAFFAVVAVIGFLLTLIPGAQQLESMGFIAVLLVTFQVERMQYGRRNKAVAWNWVDSVVDIIAGNAGFHVVYWILVWRFR